jgi:hypothetical protein
MRFSVCQAVAERLSSAIAPHRLGRLYGVYSGNPLLNQSPVQRLSWGSVPYSVLVKGANLPCGYLPQLRHPQGFLTLSGLYFPLNRYRFVSPCNAPGIYPSALFPRADTLPVSGLVTLVPLLPPSLLL